MWCLRDITSSMKPSEGFCKTSGGTSILRCLQSLIIWYYFNSVSGVKIIQGCTKELIYFLFTLFLGIYPFVVSSQNKSVHYVYPSPVGPGLKFPSCNLMKMSKFLSASQLLIPESENSTRGKVVLHFRLTFGCLLSQILDQKFFIMFLALHYLQDNFFKCFSPVFQLSFVILQTKLHTKFFHYQKWKVVGCIF